MNTRLVLVLGVAASVLLAACGAEDTACTSRDADLAAGSVTPASCSATAGSTVSIPVNLCPRCSDSRAACQAEFLGGQVEIAPVFFECEEDRGCPISPACENDPATQRVSCLVSIPANTPAGSYRIVNAGTASVVGGLEVSSGAAGCAFGLTEG